MEPKYCPQCGQPVSADAKFCPKCGCEFQPQRQWQQTPPPNQQQWQQPNPGYTTAPNGMRMRNLDMMEACKMYWQKYVDFEGRSRRAEYWWAYLMTFVIGLILGWIPVVGWLASLAMIPPSIAIGVRRLHDINKSGWFMLLNLIPIVGQIILIIWFCQEGTIGPNQYGEDPKYIFRRLTRFAVEDVSMADPNAVTQAIACWDTYERLGSPEGDLALMQLTVYLATAPKSAGVYKAMHKAFDLAKKTGSLMPPKHILNAPTKLMKELGYNRGYVYDQDLEDGGQNYFPDGISRQKLYFPVERGFEREVKKRVEYFDKLRREKNKNKQQEEDGQ